MTIAGVQGPANVVGEVQKYVVDFVKQMRKRPPSATDNFILRMHYQWTFWMFIAIDVIIMHAWYNKEVMSCVNSFNADAQFRNDYYNICLTYIYVEGVDKVKRYLFFYRYMHFVLLALAALYYIPRKFAKNFDNPRVRKLLTDFHNITLKNDDNAEKNLTERMTKYMTDHLGSHKSVYINNLLSTIFALLCDIICFNVLDFTLQGRFINYGWMAFPFKRDPIYYTDYMYRTFPQFGQCEIGPLQKLASERTEVFGCHLTVMELYDKVFLVVWAWLVILTAMTVAYFIYLCFFCHPYFRQMVLSVPKPPLADEDESVRTKIAGVLRHCKTADVFFLYKLKGITSPARFYMLMCRLSEPTFTEVVISEKGCHPVNSQAQAQPNQQNRGQVNPMDAKAQMMMHARNNGGAMRRN